MSFKCFSSCCGSSFTCQNCLNCQISKFRFQISKLEEQITQAKQRAQSLLQGEDGLENDRILKSQIYKLSDKVRQSRDFLQQSIKRKESGTSSSTNQFRQLPPIPIRKRPHSTKEGIHPPSSSKPTTCSIPPLRVVIDLSHFYPILSSPHLSTSS
jgi:hypothetical protein